MSKYKIKTKETVDRAIYNELVNDFEILLNQNQNIQIRIVYEFLINNKNSFENDNNLFFKRLMKKLKNVTLSGEELQYILSKFNEKT